MKIIAALLFSLGLIGQVQAKPYFNTIVKDPTHPKMSAELLYTPKIEFDGGVTDVALVYHKGDPTDTLWPQPLLDIGAPPFSWTLFEMGAGGNRDTGFIHTGASINVAPTLLGPLTEGLKSAGGTYAKIGTLLVAPDGGGVKLGIGWKTNIVRNGGFERFDHLSMPPRYGIGYTYQF